MTEMDLLSILAAVEGMRNSRLRNYIVPGLTSHLIGGGAHGRVRLFTAERETMEFITPHSHRFDFTCLVLVGSVENTLFIPGSDTCEEWCLSTIDQVCGAGGIMEYHHRRADKPSHWYQRTDNYVAGDTYSMTYDQIHSIKFSRRAQVLFFEGPQLSTIGNMLEPWENGRVIPTFRTEPWMFERGDGNVGAKESKT